MRVIRCDLCGRDITDEWGMVTLQTANRPLDGALSLSGIYEVCPACAEMIGVFIKRLKRGDSEEDE